MTPALTSMTILGLLCCTFAAASTEPVVHVVQTSEVSPKGKGHPSHFIKMPDVPFGPSRASNATTVSIDPTKIGQRILGFGGAITDSVATVFSQLNADLQEQVLDLLWGDDPKHGDFGGGQQYNLGRLTIGSTDFSTTVYNYDANGGQPDFQQANFSIDHDKTLILPMIARVQAKANQVDGISFVSSPWSPPGWMKRKGMYGGHMRNSPKPGMIQDPKVFQSYALYLSKYLTAYKAAGVNITRMTIQNEPDSADNMFPVSYPACNFNGTGEGEFLRDFLGPQMKKDHPEIEVFIHDGQKFHDVPILTRVKAIVDAAGGLSSGLIDGVAFHWYGKNLQNYQYLAALHAAYPTLTLLGTEATLEAPGRQHITTSPWKEAQKYAVDIIGDLNAGAAGWIEWNVLLDSSGGPTCIGSTGGTDCTPLAGHCDAPILADTKQQKLEIRDTYYFMGHFSRYIPRDSVSIGVDGATDTNSSFVATAAKTPNGDIVVVVLNTDGSKDVTYELSLNGQFAQMTIPPHAIQTLTIKES